MVHVHSRHSGTLDGRFRPLDQTTPVSVSIVLPQPIAHLASCQHTIWMLVNLLARFEKIVDRIFISIPNDVLLAGRIVPLVPRDLDLRTAVLSGAAAIDTVPVSAVEDPVPEATFGFVIGPGDELPGSIRVHGEQWWGGFSSERIPGDGTSALPFGPYVAAALAAGELYKAVRIDSYSSVSSVFYSLWTLRVSDVANLEPEWTGPAELESVNLNCVLAGVGAVGSTWVHTIWAIPGLRGTALLADADEMGVDLSNLNRCPIFGRASIGKRKASEAAAICHDAELELTPYDGTVGSAPHSQPLSIMVSAVDTNRSRQSIQSLYPARILSASTKGLRAEVLRCDPTAGTACLHCRNLLESEGESDSEIRRQYLAMNEEKRSQFATRLGLNQKDALLWATEGTCGYVGDQLAAHLRPGPTQPEEFAVGFVSVMAGTMLAALTIQEALGIGPLRGNLCRALFQFFDPLNAAINSPRFYARQLQCPMCDPSSAATAIWSKRYLSYDPTNRA